DSGHGAVEEVAVLLDRAGEDREVDLAVVVDGDDSDDRGCLSVAGEQHRTGPYALRGAGIGQRRPAQAVVVLGIEISDEVEVFHRGQSSGLVSLHGTS